MPSLRPETAKAQAKKLTSLYLKKGLNQSKVAKAEGVTRQAINQRLKQKHVQETMAQILDKSGVTDAFLGRKIFEGCEATKTSGIGVKVRPKEGPDEPLIEQTVEPDYATRHKYVVTALEVKKHIKADDNTKALTIKLEYGHRRKKLDAAA